MKPLTIQKMFACVAILFAMHGLSSAALAQVAHEINVLSRPKVREHLVTDFELIEDNAEALKAITLGLVRNVGSLKRDLRVKKVRLSKEDFSAAESELAETIERLTQESWAEAMEILSEEQIARIRQLRVQFIGADAYLDPIIADVIGLREEQTEKIKMAIQAQETKIAELKVAQREKVKEARANRRLMLEQNFANRRELDAEREAFEASLKEMLDEQQQGTYEEMRGKVFKFSLIAR